ncbi:MAG: XRE family transcriptional regulator [Bryobacteraceae bacterium]|nr:XRE family transcriptional regulator [Bryobacteraceae bacterium]MDW8379100.1 XRE family transcriptional regulator [Bryobacterales bacterium]
MIVETGTREAAPQETSEQTITRVLSSYELGNKLRMLRLRKKISLVDLGKHTGLSASMLSQLENGKLVPTLPTLARIAMVFDVGLDYFFADKRRRKLFSIVRAKERMRFPDRADNPTPNYYFEVLAFSAQEKGLQAYLAEFPVTNRETPEHYHEGAEFLFMLEGELAITFQHETHVLRRGDSVYFDSSEPHSYSARKPAKAIVITTPPRL